MKLLIKGSHIKQKENVRLLCSDYIIVYKYYMYKYYKILLKKNSLNLVGYNFLVLKKLKAYNF